MNRSGAAALAPAEARAVSLLEVAQTPPDEVLRATLVTLLMAVAALLTWSFIAELDIVASAPGKLVPLSRVKPVQASETGIVQELLVAEGDHVREGDVLLRLDPTVARAEDAQVTGELQWKRLIVRAIDAELAQTALRPSDDAPPRMLAQVQAQFRARRQALEDAVAQEREAATRAAHEKAAAQRQFDKLRQTLPTYRHAAESYAQLLKEGFVGELAANEKRREAIEKEQDLHAQESTIDALAASIAQSERRQQQLRSNYSAELLRERVEAQAALERLEQDMAKSAFRWRQFDLVAPQDGSVKDLVVRAAGHVAQAGAVLMRIVPDGDPLVAEALLANEDVGFIEVGLPARIKLTAYPFQKYGTLDAYVTQISADALDESDRASNAGPPLAYRAVLQVATQRLSAPSGESLDLTAGMAATIEIHLGRRTVMEFLTSPVRKVAAEAARER